MDSRNQERLQSRVLRMQGGDRCPLPPRLRLLAFIICFLLPRGRSVLMMGVTIWRSFSGSFHNIPEDTVTMSAFHARARSFQPPLTWATDAVCSCPWHREQTLRMDVCCFYGGSASPGREISVEQTWHIWTCSNPFTSPPYSCSFPSLCPGLPIKDLSIIHSWPSYLKALSQLQVGVLGLHGRPYY